MKLNVLTLKLQGLCHDGHSNCEVEIHGKGDVLKVVLDNETVILEGEKCCCKKDD